MSKHHPTETVELSALLVDLEGGAPTEIKLVPAGQFRSARDNRPVGIPAWVMTDEAATAILSAQSKLQSRFLIDYEHQTLRAEKNGQPAPASGWGGRLEWREGDGLYAVDVEWTEAALSAIAAKEYRYISPVINYDKKTGLITNVPMAALVNYPAIDGLNDLAAAAALLFSTPEESTMDLDDLLERLRYLLNLPLTSTAADIAAELDKLKTMITGPDGSTAGLSALLASKTDEIAALSAQIEAASEPDPTLYAPIGVVNELRGKLAALSGDTVDMQVQKLIDEGVAAGKILGDAEKDWATKLGKKDIAALSAYLDNATGIAALSGMQTGGKPPVEETGTAALSATTEELAVAQQLGLDPAELIKHRRAK